MPMAARRMRRAAVIGPAPVARTAATVATVAVVAHGVNRRIGSARRPPPLIHSVRPHCQRRLPGARSRRGRRDGATGTGIRRAQAALVTRRRRPGLSSSRSPVPHPAAAAVADAGRADPGRPSRPDASVVGRRAERRGPGRAPGRSAAEVARLADRVVVGRRADRTRAAPRLAALGATAARRLPVQALVDGDRRRRPRGLPRRGRRRLDDRSRRHRDDRVAGRRVHHAVDALDDQAGGHDAAHRGRAASSSSDLSASLDALAHAFDWEPEIGPETGADGSKRAVLGFRLPESARVELLEPAAVVGARGVPASLGTRHLVGAHRGTRPRRQGRRPPGARHAVPHRADGLRCSRKR